MVVRWLVALILALPALAQPAADNSTYFSVRPDLRKCASPLCGGSFVQRVNRLSTRCADGKLRPECYVAWVDLSALQLTPDQQAEAQSGLQQGTVLLKGSVRQKPSEGFGMLGEFVASEVWAAATGAHPRGSFFRVYNNGIVCIAAPCRSIQQYRLNSRWQRAIAEVDLDAVGADASTLERAGTSLQSPPGILVAGTHKRVSGPAGRAPALTVNQFYLALMSGKPHSCFVGGCSGQLCSENRDAISTCEWKPQYACYRTASCERQTDGRCGWTQSPELKHCLETPPSEPDGSLPQ